MRHINRTPINRAPDPARYSLTALAALMAEEERRSLAEWGDDWDTGAGATARASGAERLALWAALLLASGALTCGALRWLWAVAAGVLGR